MPDKLSLLDKQREKMRLKMADPEWRAAQYEKSKRAAERATAKKRARMATPEYREKQMEAARRQEQKRREKAVQKAANPPAKTQRSKPASKGLKGRTITAEERKIQDAIGKMPCIACQIHGKHSPEISLHHIYGRTVPDAHKYVLPLCKWHHQYAAPLSVRIEFPWLVPIHADGKIGGKASFITHNADEGTLFQMVRNNIVIF